MAVVILLDLIATIDLKLVYIKATCRTYPPTIKTIAFSGLEKVIIRFTCGGARLLPMITKTANGMQAYNVLLYPLHIKTDSATNDNSKRIALSIKLGLPNGMAIKPVATIKIKTINVARTYKFIRFDYSLHKNIKSF